MRSVVIEKNGGPEVLRLQTLDDPVPGDDELLIEQKVIGVNFIDIYQRTGLYSISLPFTPGFEGAGVVVSGGRNTSGFSPGDRVAYASASGTYADMALVPASAEVHLPAAVDFRIGGAALLQGMTAHYLSHDTFSIEDSHTCLIQAGAGGVGNLLIQMVKNIGATVITTVSTPEKAETAKKAGADHIIRYTEEDFEEKVKTITRGEGVHVVYDSVGQPTFLKSLNCLKPRGYLVSFGQSGGRIDPFDPALLGRLGSLFLTRPSLFHYIPTREKLEARAGSVFEMITRGDLTILIGTTFPLEQVQDAHRALEGRKTKGKVLLIP